MRGGAGLGIMSSRVPANAQGELQGGLGSVVSMAAIVSPPVMTGVFVGVGAAVRPQILMSVALFGGFWLFARKRMEILP